MQENRLNHRYVHRAWLAGEMNRLPINERTGEISTKVPSSVLPLVKLRSEHAVKYEL